MKKTHFILLIVTALMALFSAYSLAAINQVYKIDFDWYSQYFERYMNDNRDTSRDKWLLQDYSKDMQFWIIGSSGSVSSSENGDVAEKPQIPYTDFDKYLVIYCSLGEFNSPEYRIKVADIAQRVNVVEVKVSMNSSAKVSEKKEGSAEHTYSANDVIRINKSAFPSKGKLTFVFKSQDGRQLFETVYEIK